MYICIFPLLSVVSNGDVLNPAMRLLIHQRMLSQFERILELITEKMGLRVFGGVRRYAFSSKILARFIWTIFCPDVTIYIQYIFFYI